MSNIGCNGCHRDKMCYIKYEEYCPCSDCLLKPMCSTGCDQRDTFFEIEARKLNPKLPKGLRVNEASS